MRNCREWRQRGAFLLGWTFHALGHFLYQNYSWNFATPSCSVTAAGFCTCTPNCCSQSVQAKYKMLSSIPGKCWRGREWLVWVLFPLVFFCFFFFFFVAFFLFPLASESAVTLIISAWWSPNWILTIIHVTENSGQGGRIKLYSKFCWANKMSSQTVNKSVKTVADSIAKPGKWENDLGAQSVKKHRRKGRARTALTKVPMASCHTLPISCRTWQKSKGFWLFKKCPDPV